jgi:hypothetical protein
MADIKKTELEQEVLKDDETKVTLGLNTEDLGKLTAIVEWYRSPTRSHAIRLMLEDVYESIKKGNYGERNKV